MIQAVVFDFDGTILDTETVWYEAYREACAERGVELPLSVFAEGIGTYDDGMERYILERVGSEAVLQEIQRQARERHRAKIAGLSLREGVTDYLQEARALGLRIGLATSSPLSWVEPFLEKYALREYFDCLCTMDDVDRVKPDPELYVLAAKRLAVQPAEAVAIEDSANGARAAVSAGLRCVIVPNPVTETLNFGAYDLRISSMADVSLKTLIAKLETKIK